MKREEGRVRVQIRRGVGGGWGVDKSIQIWEEKGGGVGEEILKDTVRDE